MKPIANRILVAPPKELKDQKINGIFIPDGVAKDQFPTVEVLAVGPKVVDVKVGDHIVIDRYAMATQRITVDGQPVWLISEPDVFAVTS